MVYVIRTLKRGSYICNNNGSIKFFENKEILFKILGNQRKIGMAMVFEEWENRKTFWKNYFINHPDDDNPETNLNYLEAGL
ncbi:MAG: hypothetical protein RBS48_04965 [Ignavibacteriaceae bacterium]|jgi:hypothetical protein|nr:hypothetical protein [Ignavibacteriaceae bacterium]